MAGNFLKDYEPVEDRLRRFYAEHPKGRVETAVEWHSDDFASVVFGASVYDGDDPMPRATGFAYETISQRGVNATSHVENCETSAIGRALANAGYAPKGKRPSREEMSKDSPAATGTNTALSPAVSPAAGEPPQSISKQIQAEINKLIAEIGEENARVAYDLALHNAGVAVGEVPPESAGRKVLESLRAASGVPA